MPPPWLLHRRQGQDVAPNVDRWAQTSRPIDDNNMMRYIQPCAYVRSNSSKYVTICYLTRRIIITYYEVILGKLLHGEYQCQLAKG